MKIFSPVLKGTTTVSDGTTNLSGSFTGSLQGTAATASYVVSSQTDTAQNTRLSTIESRTGSFATTASNAFNGSQTITGSLTATGTIVAQTLVVQTITSSVEYSSGSNQFGSTTDNTHQFTGSVLVSGSLTTMGLATLSGSAVVSNKLSVNTTNGTDQFTVRGGGYYNTAKFYTSGVDTGLSNGIIISAGTNSNDGPLTVLSQANANLFLVRGDGNVGIGKTNPSYPLDVSGSIFTTDTFRISKAPSDTVQQGPSVYLVGGTGSSYTQLQQGVGRFIIFGFDGSSWQERLTINNTSGYVGIGTTSPQWMLELTKDTNSGTFGQYPAISVNNPNASGYSAYYFFSGTTNKGGIEYSNSTNALSIFGNNAERIRITSDGNVGIGTTSPIGKFQVNGDVLLGGSLNSSWAVSIDNLGTTNANGLYVNIGASSTGVPFSVYKNFSSLFQIANSGASTFASSVKLGKHAYTDFTYRTLYIGSRTYDNTFSIINMNPYQGNYNYGFDIGVYDDGTSGNQYFWVGDNRNGERLRITAAGNVGIGITNPTTSKLEVNGTETIYGKSTINATGAYTNGQAGLTVESNSWAIVDANVKRQLQRSIGYVGDYEQHVILIHPVYNGTLIEFSKCYGTIHSTRGWTYAGRISDTYEVDTSTGYNSYNGTLKSNSIQGRLYTCTYGGVKYIALIPGYRTSATQYMFDGYIANNTGGETLKLVSYRNSNTGAILNSEINNSLAEYTENDTFTNGLLYPRQGIRFNSGATTLNYYEEGDFSVTYDGGSGGLNVSSTNWAKYTRVGNLVHVDISAQVTATSTGKQYFIFRLPINFSSTTGYGPRGLVSNYNLGNNSGASSNVGIALRNTSGNLYQIYVEAVFTTTGTTDMAVSITYKA